MNLPKNLFEKLRLRVPLNCLVSKVIFSPKLLDRNGYTPHYTMVEKVIFL